MRVGLNKQQSLLQLACHEVPEEIRRRPLPHRHMGVVLVSSHALLHLTTIDLVDQVLRGRLERR